MCEEIIVKLRGRDPIWCDRAGELAEALGIPISQLPVTDDVDDDYRPGYSECLCHIDFKALGRKMEMEARKPDRANGGFSGWELSSPRSPYPIKYAPCGKPQTPRQPRRRRRADK